MTLQELLSVVGNLPNPYEGTKVYILPFRNDGYDDELDWEIAASLYLESDGVAIDQDALVIDNPSELNCAFFTEEICKAKVLTLVPMDKVLLVSIDLSEGEE